LCSGGCKACATRGLILPILQRIDDRRTFEYAIAAAALVLTWAAARAFFWNGYYTEDAPGYVIDAVAVALGHRWVPTYVNGLNVATYVPVALPIRILGKSELALSIWPALCSLLGMIALGTLASILFGRWFGWLAAFLYATYPGDVFFSTVVMPDAIQAGWLSASMCAIGCAFRSRGSRRDPWLAAAGVALGICHLARANAFVFVPVGFWAVSILFRIANHERTGNIVRSCLVYLAGWSSVLAAEGLVYLWTMRDFFFRFRVVANHYGSIGSIHEQGLSIDPTIIPLSLFAPATWLTRGQWGLLTLNQAYHGLLFAWAVCALVAGGAVSIATKRLSDRAVTGMAIGAVWLAWPILYHQFGSQSLTQFVPMHRLSRQLVVYAPGAMFAIVAGCYALWEAVRERASVRTAIVVLGCIALVVHIAINLKGERVEYDAYHHIKATYARIRDRLPSEPPPIVGDPGDLTFFDFWLNPLGTTRVRTLPFSGYASCRELQHVIVLTRSDPGWFGARAEAIEQAVRRLPCLVQPPANWQLLYDGYPERVFVVD
jgi:dolichyl-phosphate-mannose-protein mannosyltransferase